jgi:hypothetical protein
VSGAGGSASTTRSADAFPLSRTSSVALSRNSTPRAKCWRAGLRVDRRPLSYQQRLLADIRESDSLRCCPLAARRIFEAGRGSKADFIEIAQATRNDLAHLFTEPLGRAAKSTNDLFRITEQAGALLNALLLVDAGFDDADVGEMLWRGRRIDNVRIW